MYDLFLFFLNAVRGDAHGATLAAVDITYFTSNLDLRLKIYAYDNVNMHDVM